MNDSRARRFLVAYVPIAAGVWSTVGRSVVAMLLLAIAGFVAAQSLDGIDVLRDRGDALLVLRFASDIQLLRSDQTASRDRVRIVYRLVGQPVNGADGNRTTRRLGPRNGLPHMAIEDRGTPGADTREIVLAARAPLDIDVRAGRDRQSIVLRLKGLGASVRPSQAAVTGAIGETGDDGADTRFEIVLTVTTTGDQAPVIPGSLQGIRISRRPIERAGRPAVEWVAGDFASRAQAERVARSLTRFPNAVVRNAQAAARGAEAVERGTAAAARRVRPAPTGTQGPAADRSNERLAAGLLQRARASFEEQDYGTTLDLLDELLNLPPTAQHPEALELAGLARLRSGDPRRARIEFESYLETYPGNEGADRVRQHLATIDSATTTVAAAAAPVRERNGRSETTVSASASSTYYGGNGRYRSQDFEDSPISGLPVAAGEEVLTPDKSSQLISDVDLRWRDRNESRELGFVIRDSYLADFERSNRNRQRLSSAYLDYKSYENKFDLRLGRQSPRGGGVMGRFDGARLAWRGIPDWTLGVVAGQPADDLFQTRRDFVGASVDVDGIGPGLGAGVYVIRQSIDGATDRQAVGLEGRYLNGGVSVFSQIDYDLDFQRTNITSVQATWLRDEGTTFNALFDRRALTMLSLGNALAFIDPANPVLPSTLSDVLNGTTTEALRGSVAATTPYVSQASIGATRPFGEHWRASASLQSVETGAIPPIPGLAGFEQGRPASGRTLTSTLSLVGLNLLSRRDVNVITASHISGSTLSGLLISVNGSYSVGQNWQLEPTLQFYRDESTHGDTNERWTPGLRVTYRGWKHFSLESNLTWETGRAHRVDFNDQTRTTEESTRRIGYSLGLRYDL
ncbi:MAG: tetratricopeptide repeat protein [Burkholderiaceae bacterium]